MKKNTLTLLLILIFGGVYAQENHNYRKQMIESGEKAEPLDLVKSFPSDFESFKQAKAWNAKVGSSILTNPSDLDIAAIGGRVRSSLVDIKNNITLLAPSGGGLWKFNPADGTPFTPVKDFGSFLAVTSITQNPNNPKNILVATGDEHHDTNGNGIFQSTDGGNTFTQLASTNPTTNADFSKIRFVKFSPNTANLIYLSAGGKVYKSTDSGTSWTKVFQSTGGNVRSLDFLAGDVVIFSVDGQGLYKSTTGNNGTFTLIPGLTPKPNAVVVASHAANRNIAYTIATVGSGQRETGEVYKTINSGITWSKLPNAVILFEQSWFVLTLGIHPTNPNIVVAGSVGWGYSKDGGATWKPGAGLEVDFHDVHFHASQPDVAYLGYDQGVGRVDFANEQLYWVEVSATKEEEQLQPTQLELGKRAGFNTSQIYYGDFFPKAYGDAYLMGQQDGGSFASVSGDGARILVSDGGSAFVNKQDPKKAFASTQNNNLQRSANAVDLNVRYASIPGFSGNTTNWITQFEGNNADGDQIYIAKAATIERTIDGGTSFTSIGNHDLSGVKIAVESAVNPVVYAAGDKKTGDRKADVIRIDNAKTSPALTTIVDILPAAGSPDHITIDPNNRNTFFITSTDGNAYKVTNANAAVPTITSIRGNIPKVVFNTVIGVINHPELLIAGTNIGLFYSQDGGKIWTLSGKIPYTQVTDLKLRNSDNRLFIFTYGRGAWAATLDLTVTALTNNIPNTLKIDVFPNPSKEVININTNETGNLNSILYDVKGNKVLESEKMKNINIENLSDGLYILHLIKDGEVIATEKVVIE